MGLQHDWEGLQIAQHGHGVRQKAVAASTTALGCEDRGPFAVRCFEISWDNLGWLR